MTSSEIDKFKQATLEYMKKLEAQLIAKQTEPNIVSNALKPYFEKLDYAAESFSQKGNSGIDLALMFNQGKKEWL